MIETQKTSDLESALRAEIAELKAEIAALTNERDEWKNAHQIELEAHVRVTKERNALRAEITKLK